MAGTEGSARGGAAGGRKAVRPVATARRGGKASLPAAEELRGLVAGGDKVARPAARRAGGTSAPVAKGRRAKARLIVRWSGKRERTFLETLLETANVAASIRASGLSETNVYRKRRQCGEFRAKWAATLREAHVRLETMLLDRAINGVRKTVWHGGKKVGTMIEYSDRLALALLARHRETPGGQAGDAAPAPAPDEAALRAAFNEQLSAMNKAMGGAG